MERTGEINCISYIPLSKIEKGKDNYMNIFFTADTHFGDSKIIHLCKRPFRDVEEMNYILIKNWNARVKPGDMVFHLGDFAFRKGKKYTYYMEQLNGHIVIVKGNHDRNNGVNTVVESMIIRYGGHKLFLVHKPIHRNRDFKINLVGHVHNHWSFRRMRRGLFTKMDLINVGVDVHDFYPVTINEILSKYTKWRKQKSRGESK